MILCIESATKNCSVSFFSDEDSLHREQSAEKYIHAETLHRFIDEVIQEAGTKPQAIAVSMGPGSYTGLRIGVAAAKGLSFSWDIPLIGIPTLDHMAKHMSELHPGYAHYIPMIDARRMEVFTRVYNSEGEPITEVEAHILEESSFSDLKGSAFVFGDGAEKSKEVLQGNFEFDVDYLPTAKGMQTIASKRLAEKSFEDVAYFEPFYLKEFIAGKPRPLL